MWSWRHKDMPKRWTLWLKLCVLSLCAHVCVLLLFFFVFHGSYYVYNIEIAQRIRDAGVPVIFLPLQKRVVNQKLVRKKAQLAARKAKNEMKRQSDVAQPRALKKNKTTLVRAAPKKATPKKVASKRKDDTKMLAAKKTEAKKKGPVKVVAKKAETKSTNNPPPTKKVAQTKEQPKLAQDRAALAQAIDAESGIEDIKDVLYVGQYELDALRMQEFMHEEILAHWRPPVGVAKESVCEIKVLVDWYGQLKNVEVCKPSGVLIYDISARTALQAIKELPRWVRGKEFIISFKQ